MLDVLNIVDRCEFVSERAFINAYYLCE